MEQRFILRLAEIDDIPSIMEIEQICFDKDSFSKRQFVYLISQAKGYFCVAEYQQRVGGYSRLKVVPVGLSMYVQ